MMPTHKKQKTSPITQRVSSWKQVGNENEVRTDGSGNLVQDANTQTELVEDKVTDINESTGVNDKKAPKADTTEMYQGDDYIGDVLMKSDRFKGLSGQALVDAGHISADKMEDWNTRTGYTAPKVDDKVSKVNEIKPSGVVPVNVAGDQKVVLSRGEAGNQARREGMLDRKTRRRDRKAHRQLKRQAAANRRDAIKSGEIERGDMTRRDALSQGYGLSDKQKAVYDYTKKNRKAGSGVVDNYNFETDSEGNTVITGNKLSSLSDSSGASQGTSINPNTTRGSMDALAKIVNTGGTLSAEDQARYDAHLASFKQKTLNPISHKKQVDLLDESGNVIRRISNTSGGSSSNLPVVQQRNLPVKSKVKNTLTNMRNTKTKGKWGTLTKVAGGLGLAGLTWLGLGTTSSDENKTEDPPKPKPTKGKSWDQAYQDRDRKVYGHLNKADYIKEGKRQKDIHAKTGKWDWRNAPKDPGPVKSEVKPELKVTTKDTTDLKVDTAKVVDSLKTKPTVPTVEPKVSEKKVEKLDNRLGRLKDRKVTPRRERKIAKLEQKKAGVDKATIRANKVIDKNLGKAYSALTEGKIEKASRNYAKAQRHVDKPNPNVPNTLAERETQLKKASGFTQKGWSGYQQKKK